MNVRRCFCLVPRVIVAFLPCFVTFLGASLTLASTAGGETPTDVPTMRDRVDALLAERWKEAGVVPAEPASDAEFFRRAHLDLIGTIPKAGDVR